MPRDVSADVAAVLERLLRLVRLVATTGQLSFPAAALLARLVRQGPQRLTDLAVSEGVSQPGMTQLVGRLERDGLARREPSAEDGRVTVVHVTGRGRQVVERRRAERADAIAGLLAQLDDADRAAIAAALPALQRLTDLATGADASPRTVPLDGAQQ